MFLMVLVLFTRRRQQQILVYLNVFKDFCYISESVFSVLKSFGFVGTVNL